MKKRACTSAIIAIVLACTALSGCVKSDMPEAQEPVQQEKNILSMDYVSEEMKLPTLGEVHDKEPPKDYPISVDTKTYIDMFGSQVIEKTYVLPFDVSISDAAPMTILENNIEFSRTNVLKPQNYADKKVTKDKVAGTEEEAGKFHDKIEYDDTDGKGVLTLDPNSVKVEVNSTEKTPHSNSATKTYNMAQKDYNSIPQTIKSNGTTMYLTNVSWSQGGDPGTGINGTGEESAYGTYNTIAQTWIATATYSATTYSSKSDYKGAATYVGKILVKNSPTYQYVVTYKPSTMVSNSSGLYANNFQNSYYNGLNQQLTAREQLFQSALSYEVKKDQLENAKKDLSLEKEGRDFRNELKKQESEMNDTVVIVMMAVMAIFLLLIMGALVIAFILAKKLMERNNLNMTEIILNKDGHVSSEPYSEDEINSISDTEDSEEIVSGYTTTKEVVEEHEL